MKQHYTYQLVGRDSATGNIMKYIGVRSCKGSPFDDTEYYGSSKHTPEDIRETHVKNILSIFNTREEAMQHEIELHERFNVSVNKGYYNKAKATSKFFDVTGTKWTQEHRKLMSDKRKGVRKSAIHKKRIGEAHKGTIRSAEQRLNISKSKRGDKHPFWGMKRPEHSRRMIEVFSDKTKCARYGKFGKDSLSYGIGIKHNFYKEHTHELVCADCTIKVFMDTNKGYYDYSALSKTAHGKQKAHKGIYAKIIKQ